MRLMPKLMGFKSNIRWGMIAKYTWVFAGISILFLGLGTFLVEPAGSVVPNLLLSLMILLSFPSGFVLFLLTWPFVDIYPPIDFFLLWLVVFLIGYFQWFQVISNLRGRLITLSLAQVEPNPSQKQSAIKDPGSQKVRVNRKPALRVVHFDAAGRTPLERVINSTARSPSKRTEL